MTRKLKTGILLAALLGSSALYYFFPVWWENYTYENNAIQVHVYGYRYNKLEVSPAGTFVIRLAGRGRASCGWDYVEPKISGFSNVNIARIDSISSEETDDAGFADAESYDGIGWGKRNVLMGGCRNGPAYILILIRPGFETRILSPEIDQINSANQSIRKRPLRRPNYSQEQYARVRISQALQLLYPTSFDAKVTEHTDTLSLESFSWLPQYWQHKLPDGRSVRRYFLDDLENVLEGMDCPTLSSRVREIFDATREKTMSEEDVITEHNALHPLIGTTKETRILCGPSP